MSISAASLITAAKQRAFAQYGTQKISDPALLQEISSQDQLIVQLISQQAPDLLATVTGIVSLSDAGNVNGYTLAAGVHYRDFTHVDGDEYTPITMVRRQDQERGVRSPAGMLRSGSGAGVFYPVDPAKKRWAGTDTREWYEPDSSHYVTYSYVPLPAALTGLSSTITSPDMAREVFISALVMAILLMNPPKTEVDVAVWSAQIQAATAARTIAMQTLLMQVAKFTSHQGNPSPTSDDFGLGWVERQIGD